MAFIKIRGNATPSVFDSSSGALFCISCPGTAVSLSFCCWEEAFDSAWLLDIIVGISSDVADKTSSTNKYEHGLQLTMMRFQPLRQSPFPFFFRLVLSISKMTVNVMQCLVACGFALVCWIGWCV
jgi:hypothetical protein